MEREAESRSAFSCLIHLCFSPADFKLLEALKDPPHLKAAGITVSLGSQHSSKKAVSFDRLVDLSLITFVVQRRRYQEEVQKLKF